MDTVIARSRSLMWTAFRTPSGVAILNVVEPPLRYGPVVSIVLDDVDVRDLLSPLASSSRVEDLLRRGRRLAVPLPTPALSPGERLAA